MLGGKGWWDKPRTLRAPHLIIEEVREAKGHPLPQTLYRTLRAQALARALPERLASGSVTYRGVRSPSERSHIPCKGVPTA